MPVIFYSRQAGHRVGEHLQRIMPMIVQYSKVENDDELREYCIQVCCKTSQYLCLKILLSSSTFINRHFQVSVKTKPKAITLTHQTQKLNETIRIQSAQLLVHVHLHYFSQRQAQENHWVRSWWSFANQWMSEPKWNWKFNWLKITLTYTV